MSIKNKQDFILNEGKRHLNRQGDDQMKQDTAETDKLIMSRGFWDVKSRNNRVYGNSEGLGCHQFAHDGTCS